ncbi:hypothetical protein [Chitinivorax sp. B]|uniref:hypothetical protein n=1 Tax=Chitinivorax sp. B TaxID=2502235 RepID=UPI0010F738F1|nr:hypothetical protein [Chitinivorax sp. B]
MTYNSCVVRLANPVNQGFREVQLLPPLLAGLFENEDGCVVTLSLDKLADRITHDRGSLSSLIGDLENLNRVFRDIETNRPLTMPVLNSRRRDVSKQMVVDTGRHQLYALRNLGADELPVVVPTGLAEQFENTFGPSGDPFLDDWLRPGNQSLPHLARR